jgi:prenyltransferase beta subunit
MDRAYEYLIRSQLPDGSWGGGDPFVCARVLCALQGHAPEDIVKRGLEYLEGCQQKDGHFAPKTKRYSTATSTAYSLIVLNRFDYGKASLPVSRGIIWLLESQDQDGSWGSNKVKKAYTTTFCLRALHTFYLSGLQRFKAGLEYALDYLDALDFGDEPVSHIYASVLNLKRIGYLDAGLENKFIEYAAARAGQATTADAAYLLGTLKALGEMDISAKLEEHFITVNAWDDDPGLAALVVLAVDNRL